MEIQTQPIELSQKEQIERIRELGGNKLSANTFDSLYLWQQQMGLSVYIDDDFFAVKCSERGQNTWFFPCGDRTKTLQFIKNKMSDKDFALCYIDEDDAAWLEEAFPAKWELLREEESDEYICRIADFIGLSGGKYLGIRHKINRILRENTVKTSVITDETVADALAVVSEWDKLPHHIGNNNLVDRGVSDRALIERSRLGIDGVIVYIGETPMAVFAGFPIDGDTVDALVGKCRHDAPGGFVYYAIHEYFKYVADKYTYCNLEEDLGIAGIRMIKEGLRPEKKNLIRTAVRR